MRTSSIGRAIAAGFAGLLLAVGATPARAGEGLFGFVYTLDLQPKGSWEFEQRVDTTHGQAVGSYNLTELRSELEYGLTNDVQIAGYLNAFRVQANKQLPQPRDLRHRPVHGRLRRAERAQQRRTRTTATASTAARSR